MTATYDKSTYVTHRDQVRRLSKDLLATVPSAAENQGKKAAGIPRTRKRPQFAARGMHCSHGKSSGILSTGRPSNNFF